jgi:hypothetical protein
MQQALESIRGLQDGWVVFGDSGRPDNYVQLPGFGIDPISTTVEAAARHWPGVTSPPLSDTQLRTLSLLGFSTTPDPNYQRVLWTRTPGEVARVCDEAMMALGSDPQYDLRVETSLD